ncbi:hypothetical protein C0J52_10730 [Blattella germanica]|nr:hypothetical protein C0J52_10730 [Blattella germanica]
MFWVSVLLPALMLTLVYLASAEQPKSESTAQDVVNCSNVDVSSLLESVRSIEIGIASEEDDSSEEEEEEPVSDSIKRILRDLVHALEAVESQTIDLSPPKAVPLDEYSMICQNEAPSPSVLNNATNDSTSSHDIREQLNLLASQSKDLIEPVVPWLHCVLPTAEELEIEQMQDIEEMLNVYVDPAVYAVIFVLGLVWNGVLILIFVRQKQLWTPPNVMVFNLALADLISLVWNVAFFCFEIYTKQDIDNDEDFCVYHVIGRPMSIALVALSEGALSILSTRLPVHLHGQVHPWKLQQVRQQGTDQDLDHQRIRRVFWAFAGSDDRLQHADCAKIEAECARTVLDADEERPGGGAAQKRQHAHGLHGHLPPHLCPALRLASHPFLGRSMQLEAAASVDVQSQLLPALRQPLPQPNLSVLDEWHLQGSLQALLLLFLQAV